MKTNLKKYIKEIFTFALILFIALNLISYFRSTDLNKSNLKESSFILLDGSTYTIDKTKPLLIHFWATWCPVCKFEASNIENISKEYNVLTIAVQEKSKESITQYMKQNNLSYKVIDDYNGTLAREFNISVYPTTFIYNQKGELKFSEVGYTSTLGLKLRMFLTNF